MIRTLTATLLSLSLFSASASFASYDSQANSADLVNCATSADSCFVIKNPDVKIGNTSYTVVVPKGELAWEQKMDVEKFMKDYCAGFQGTFAGYTVANIKEVTKVVAIFESLRLEVTNKKSISYSVVTNIVCTRNK